jgi:hypothetical protein
MDINGLFGGGHAFAHRAGIHALQALMRGRAVEIRDQV